MSKKTAQTDSQRSFDEEGFDVPTELKEDEEIPGFYDEEDDEEGFTDFYEEGEEDKDYTRYREDNDEQPYGTDFDLTGATRLLRRIEALGGWLDRNGYEKHANTMDRVLASVSAKFSKMAQAKK